MGRPVVHWEMLTKDPAKAADFYEKIFDWKIKRVPILNYRIVETGAPGGINGGIFDPGVEDAPPTTLYIDVDDLAAYREKIVAGGGKIIIEKKDIPGMGSISIFADPEGRVMGLWKRK